MRSMGLVLCGFLFLCFTARGTDRPVLLPVISLQDFNLGRSWTWDYFDVEGHPYSSEIYRVIKVENSVVTFEMSSAYQGGTEYTAHHRLRADVSHCLKAYRNPADPQPWSIELFYLENGRWTSSGMSLPLGFEEKFNCNPHQNANRWQHTPEFAPRQSSTLFHHRRKTGTETSWFDLDGPEAAVAREKEFFRRGRVSYRFLRR